MAEYRLSPTAERDLADIWRYTLKQWGDEQADRYILALAAACADLAATPEKGQDCAHIRSGYRRPRVERHFIYFRLATYGIAVIRILHERMDAPRHL
ncbi:MAG: plasmid stabilization protein ParE [Caulobacteraceae bacterium]|nr:plasmid stabilization protein ParE [Caulobacteraceae bacterium]